MLHCSSLLTRARRVRRHTERPLSLVAALVVATATGCGGGPQLFVDAAYEQDLEFISYSGDNVWYLIDTLGSGLAAGDYDDDGRADLYLLTGSAITEAFRSEANEYGNAMWRNRPAGFEDVTEEVGLGTRGWSTGAVFADYDGDGDLDLWVGRHGPNQLWRNDGDGRFVEVAARAGLDDPNWAVAAAFADLDGDEDLDLYVTNYAKFDIEEESGTVRWFTTKQFPHYFPPTDNVLYRNNGDGTFTDVTETAGPEGAGGTGRSMAVLAADFDLDGDLDLFVANDIGFNDLYQNHGDWEFENIGLLSGVACDAEGRFQASMGADAGDYDNDGDLDIFVTNYGGEYHTLYRNEGDLLFTDVTREVGLINQSTMDSVGWGAGFFDFDLDGAPDLMSVNGHVVQGIAFSAMRRPWWLPGWLMGADMKLEEDVSEYPQMGREAFNMPADQPKHLFFNRGDGTFEDATFRAGSNIHGPRMSRGAAFADFDGDGRMDVAVSNKNQPAQVLLNRIPRRGRALVLQLRWRSPNVFAVGARARVHAGDLVLTREQLAGASYSGSNAYGLHFGLGNVDKVDAVEIRWPDGATERFEDLDADAVYRLAPGAEPRQLRDLEPAGEDGEP